jgi:hypothetical protein
MECPGYRAAVGLKISATKRQTAGASASRRREAPHCIVWFPKSLESRCASGAASGPARGEPKHKAALKTLRELAGLAGSVFPTRLAL